MKFLKKHGKLIGICLSICTLLLCFACVAFATEESTSSNVLSADQAISSVQSMFSSVTSVLNFTNVAQVIGIGLASATGIWLAWWGIRKLIRIITSSLTRGRISL